MDQIIVAVLTRAGAKGRCLNFTDEVTKERTSVRAKEKKFELMVGLGITDE